MKVISVSTFEGFDVPSNGAKQRGGQQTSVTANDQVVIRPHGGGFLVDWGDSLPQNREKVCTLIGPSNVRSALVVLEDGDRPKK